jgi:sterol desaturase/sphingolipid hydroxylase (fatty acid hydroxylase superfamily)
MFILAGTLTAKVLVGKSFLVVFKRAMQMLLIAVVFVPLERLIPFHPGQRLFRKRLGLDFLHFYAGGLFIIIVVYGTYMLAPGLSAWAGIHASPISVRHLPIWGQFLVFEGSWTFLGYWVHRLEHTWAPLWRLHSIHESTQELDWLSAFRLHPLEPVLFQVLTIVPLWFFGMSVPAAVAYKIYSYVFAHVQHSNIVFPIGPLKYILPTPAFHRWHHARVYNAEGKAIRSFRNFSEYPIWDILFGTFELPDERPTVYGNAPYVPMDYLAQLAYPFGADKAVLAWEARMRDRFPAVPERIAKWRASIAPVHEAFEARLARLCLVRPGGSPPSAALAPAAILTGENS